VLVRQVLGAIAQFEKTSLVAKLRAARDRKKAATGKCGGRRSYVEARPDVVALASAGGLSLRKISLVKEAVPAPSPAWAIRRLQGLQVVPLRRSRGPVGLQATGPSGKMMGYAAYRRLPASHTSTRARRPSGQVLDFIGRRRSAQECRPNIPAGIPAPVAGHHVLGGGHLVHLAGRQAQFQRTLAEGHLTSGGKPYVASAVQAMLAA
jgi:hypothetical protein